MVQDYPPNIINTKREDVLVIFVDFMSKTEGKLWTTPSTIEPKGVYWSKNSMHVNNMQYEFYLSIYPSISIFRDDTFQGDNWNVSLLDSYLKPVKILTTVYGVKRDRHLYLTIV